MMTSCARLIKKQTLKREDEIIEEAKAEAEKIRERARKEMELEKKQAIDDMKKEMIEVATLIAGKVVSGNIDVKVQEKLVDDTLQEIGDSTWPKHMATHYLILRSRKMPWTNLPQK